MGIKRSLYSDTALIKAFALPGFLSAELMGGPQSINQECDFIKVTVHLGDIDLSLLFPGG
jgi:hypothetical protein